LPVVIVLEGRGFGAEARPLFVTVQEKPLNSERSFRIVCARKPLNLLERFQSHRARQAKTKA
jgi:hypothetical protein